MFIGQVVYSGTWLTSDKTVNTLGVSLVWLTTNLFVLIPLQKESKYNIISIKKKNKCVTMNFLQRKRYFAATKKWLHKSVDLIKHVLQGFQSTGYSGMIWPTFTSHCFWFPRPDTYQEILYICSICIGLKHTSSS